MSKNLILALLLCAAPISYSQAQEDSTAPQETTEPGFIKDNLFIYMHAGPATRFRIKGSVNAGTEVTVLQRDAESDFIQIRDQKDRTGWIDKRFFSEQPGLAATLETTNTTLKEELEQAQQIIQQAESESFPLQEQVKTLREQNNNLSSQINELSTSKDALQKQIDQTQESQAHLQMMYGAGIGLAGLILGLILPFLIPKGNRSDKWM